MFSFMFFHCSSIGLFQILSCKMFQDSFIFNASVSICNFFHKWQSGTSKSYKKNPTCKQTKSYSTEPNFILAAYRQISFSSFPAKPQFFRRFSACKKIFGSAAYGGGLGV